MTITVTLHFASEYRGVQFRKIVLKGKYNLRKLIFLGTGKNGFSSCLPEKASL